MKFLQDVTTRQLVYKEPHGIFAPAVEREVRQCSFCPFAGHTENMKACILPFHLDYNRNPVPFRERNENGWDVYPSPPPGWCPLRQRDYILKLDPTLPMVEETMNIDRGES